MHHLLAYVVNQASGKLLWANTLALVALKVLVPLSDFGHATISNQLSIFSNDTIIQLTNEARAESSLPALVSNAALTAAAEAKLDDMAAQGYFSHESPDGRQPWDFISYQGYAYRAAGENLARGFTDEISLVTAWLESPSHRDNVLNGAYHDIGVASRYITTDGRPGIVVVELFGSLRSSGAAAIVPPTANAQRISTDGGVAPVQTPISATATLGSATSRVSSTLSSWLALWLTALLALLTVAVLTMGPRRRLLWAWAGNAALLALVALVPTLSFTSGVIF